MYCFILTVIPGFPEREGCLHCALSSRLSAIFLPVNVASAIHARLVTIGWTPLFKMHCGIQYNQSTIQGIQSVTKHSDSTTKWWIYHILDYIVISEWFCLLAVLFPVSVECFCLFPQSSFLLLFCFSRFCPSLFSLLFLWGVLSLNVLFACQPVLPITLDFTTFTPVPGFRHVSSTDNNFVSLVLWSKTDTHNCEHIKL